MSLQQRQSSLILSREKSGLIYDADGVALLGRYGDELSAHRTKKQWIEVLGSYFLLERDRDFEIFVEANEGEKYFLLTCCFSSACGRYAFWRLINRQAPEAEQRLGGNANINAKRTNSKVDVERKSSWLLNAIDQQSKEIEENTNLLQRIIKLFQ